MSISLNQWCSSLEQVNPTLNGPHSWICKVKRKDSPSTIEVLTDKEYQEFYKQNSWWNASCKKLSLNNIVFISRELVDQQAKTFTILSSSGYKINPKHDVESEIFHLFNLGNVFDAGFGNKFVQELDEAESISDVYSKMATALKNMSARAANKKTIEKTKGVWGLIKGYIYNWLFDKTKRIKSIIESVPSVQGVYKSAIKGIRERILMNMKSVEDALNYPDRTNFDDKGIYPDSKSVMQGWYNRFHPDKIAHLLEPEKNVKVARLINLLPRRPQKNFFDKESFQRVVALVKIWRDIENFEKGSSNLEPNQNLPSDNLLIGNNDASSS